MVSFLNILERQPTIKDCGKIAKQHNSQHRSRCFYTPSQHQAFLYWLTATSCILLPSNYATDLKTDENAGQMLQIPWPTDTSIVEGTCKVYEKIGHHPRLLNLLRRDEWSGFPILERPTGIPMNTYLEQHDTEMYPDVLNGTSRRLSERYQSLVISWAVQILSAIKFLHSHGVLFGTIDTDSCFLDLNLGAQMVCFMTFLVEDEQKHEIFMRSDELLKINLQDWAMLCQKLLFRSFDDKLGVENHVLHTFKGIHDDIPGAKVLERFKDGQFQNANQLWSAFITELEDRKFSVGEDCLRGFDPSAF